MYEVAVYEVVECADCAGACRSTASMARTAR